MASRRSTKMTFDGLLKQRKRRWTEAQKDFLKQHSGDMSDQDMANRLKKTIKSIREMRYRLDIIKKSGRGVIELRDDKLTMRSRTRKKKKEDLLEGKDGGDSKGANENGGSIDGGESKDVDKGDK